LDNRRSSNVFVMHTGREFIRALPRPLSALMFSNTANNGVYFTNTLPWTNGLLGGGYLHTGSDWLAAQTNFNNGNNPASGSYNYAGYSNNPAIGVWVSTNNISVSNNAASVTASSTVNTLKLSGPATVTISPGQILAIRTGGLLVSGAGTGTSAINGGTLVGAPGADLIVLQNYKSSPLTIGSVIADNGSATALTLGGLGGTLILTNSETYTGATYVNNGTLALAGGGSISGSPLITVSSGATIDASQLSSGMLSLVGGQTLKGNGSVNGSVTVAPGGVVATGAGDIGTLTFSNNLSLAGTVVMKLCKDNGYSDQSDLLAVGGTLTCGGTLNVTNIGSGTLTNGDSFRLFSAGGYSGAFTNIVPATPGAGLAWNASLLAVNGTLSVTYPPPVFAGAVLSGTNFTFFVTNSVAGATNYVLTSTNMALPLTNWMRVATNVFDASGNLAFTNGMDQSQPARFYLLQLP